MKKLGGVVRSNWAGLILDWASLLECLAHVCKPGLLAALFCSLKIHKLFRRQLTIDLDVFDLLKN